MSEENGISEWNKLETMYEEDVSDKDLKFYILQKSIMLTFAIIHQILYHYSTRF